ncbi:hypothetical protein QQ045_021695 [Rhodiola kirilowii]
MSIYREEAIEALIEALRRKEFPSIQIMAWRNGSLSTTALSALVAWAITALAFGLASKEINVGGYRGWRLRVLEAFIIILAFTQLLYLLMLYVGMFNSKYGPGYRNA